MPEPVHKLSLQDLVSLDVQVTSAYGIRATSYWALIRALIQMERGLVPADNVPYLQVEMPCSSVVKYADIGDIPTESVACPCGDSAHWIIKYE